jgi:nitroreductase
LLQSNFNFHRFRRSKAMPTSEEVEKLKHVPETTGVADVIRRRWSPRIYSDKDISSEELTRLFEAARWAASSSNEQPWRFIVGRRGDETYKKILSTLVEFNQMWVKTAPVLVISVAKKTFTGNGSLNPYNLHDTGAASANLALQATADGLHIHSMGGFDREAARAVFGIPSDYEVGAAIAIGYFGNPDDLHERMRKNEVAPRQRKSLEEFVFSDWEKPAKL